jgi:hypothetical protein
MRINFILLHLYPKFESLGIPETFSSSVVENVLTCHLPYQRTLAPKFQVGSIYSPASIPGPIPSRLQLFFLFVVPVFEFLKFLV